MSPTPLILRYLAIAVPCTLRRILHYLPLPAVPLPFPGIRVRVPYGKRELVGVVLQIDSETQMPAEKLRPVLAYLDAEPLLDNALLELYRWASQYYLHPVGLCVQTSLPKALREGRELPSLKPSFWQLTEGADPDQPLRSALQTEVLQLLACYQRLSQAEISVLLNRRAAPLLKALAAKNLITWQESSETISSNAPLLRQPPLELNSQQQPVLASLVSCLGKYSCHLLEGITGSGKTEIYLQLIEQVLQLGQQALVLIPEISLTPQTLSRFEQRFSCEIAVFHSALTDKQRLEGWLKARNGSARIVIGTRSAMFTPLKSPGIFIIDEEHDDSYKQQDGFRYSARDLGIWRAHQLGVPVLLGTATPSLESLNNALLGRYQLHKLDQRAGLAIMPSLKPVDLRRESIREGFSQTLLASIGKRLEAGEQVLVFLNRRGFAPMLRCQLCGWIAECPRCERAYTLHQQPAALRCHHCEAHKPIPLTCGQCHQASLSGEGLGTERSEYLLTEEFPDFPVIRIDSDTTRAQGSLEALMRQVNSGIPCILVGTQMIAKGHHFPRVTLVAVLDADSGLFSADFRSQENLGQLLTQVAGRAGRSEAPGTVMIQTWYPDHPTLLSLLNQGYSSFARQLLLERESGALPPFVHFILIRAEASRRELPMELLGQVRQLLDQQPDRGVLCLGPMPSPYGKKAGNFRGQLILQATRRATLQKAGSELVTAIETLPLARKVRWNIDVDPLDFS